MKPLAIGLLVPVLVASLGGASASESGSAAEVAVSDRILVSTPHHRMGEFIVAKNPRDRNHLVVAAMDWDDEAGSVGCATFVSRDGGATWRPGGRVPGLDHGFTRFDPWVTIDPQGRAHLQCLQYEADPALYTIGSVDGTSGRPTVVQLHARSDDGGDNWKEARRIPPRDAKNQVDKNAIHASSAGTLYACIEEYPRPSSDLVVSRSFDGGESWTEPMALDEAIGVDSADGAGFGVCNGFAEGPNGEVYLMWQGVFPKEPRVRFGTAATFDGGATWSGTIIDAARRPTNVHPWVNVARNLAVGPFPAAPSIAVSPVSGDVFVSDQQYIDDAYKSVLYRSTNGGRSYEKVPLPPIPATECHGCHEMRPSIAVDDRGRLGVQVMLTSKEFGLHKEVWFLISPDGGESWLYPILLSSTGPDRSYLDPRNWMPNDAGPLLNQGMYIAQHPEKGGAVVGWDAAAAPRRNDHIRWGGDYWGITASSKGFVALWEDHWANGTHQLWARLIRVELLPPELELEVTPSQVSGNGPVDIAARITDPDGVDTVTSASLEVTDAHDRSVATWDLASFSRDAEWLTLSIEDFKLSGPSPWTVTLTAGDSDELRSSTERHVTRAGEERTNREAQTRHSKSASSSARLFSGCRTVSPQEKNVVSTLNPNDPVALLSRRPGASLISLDEGKQSSATIHSNDSVLATFRSYRRTLLRGGFEFFLVDYEGFEAELFGSRRTGLTVVVKIVQECDGSMAFVTLSK